MKTLATAALTVLCAPALAQTEAAVPSLPEVTVSTPRGAAPVFEVPASIDLVDRRQLRDARLQVNLSEGLGGVPGLLVADRQNYAQDVQISVRGFGARSTFGIRGVRLYVDGIPATLPDGQGQIIERRPRLGRPHRGAARAVLGAVRQLVGRRDAGLHRRRRAARRRSALGGRRQRRRAAASAAKAAGRPGALGYVLGASHFSTDGYREHSAARAQPRQRQAHLAPRRRRAS